MKQAIQKIVLIIDDEADFSLLLKNYLLQKNYTVRIAHTLNSAMLDINQNAPDIILLDQNACSNLKDVERMIREAAPEAWVVVGGEKIFKDFIDSL